MYIDIYVGPEKTVKLAMREGLSDWAS